MLHGKSLFYWSAGSQQIKLIDKNCSNMVYLNDDHFLYMVQEKEKLGEKTQELQKINLIESRFATL